MTPRKIFKIITIILLFIIIILLGSWYIIGDINTIEVVLTGITATATVILAISVYQLDITLNQLKFETLNKIYDILHQDIKEELNEISKWAKEGKKPEEIIEGSEENFNKVRFVSVAFNKIGYYLYRGFIDEDFVQEEFGGLIVRSFVAIRPYLKYIRDKSEPPEKPWFMRRFYLLAVVVCEDYLRNSKQNKKEFEKYLEKIVKEYGDEDTIRDFQKCSLVPEEWMADDIKKWLKKRGYLKKGCNKD